MSPHHKLHIITSLNIFRYITTQLNSTQTYNFTNIINDLIIQIHAYDINWAFRGHNHLSQYTIQHKDLHQELSAEILPRRTDILFIRADK